MYITDLGESPTETSSDDDENLVIGRERVGYGGLHGTCTRGSEESDLGCILRTEEPLENRLRIEHHGRELCRPEIWKLPPRFLEGLWIHHHWSNREKPHRIIRNWTVIKMANK